MSTERVIVDDAVADAFAAGFAEKASGLVAGPPDQQVHLGSVVDADAVAHVADLLADAEAKGAKRLCGGVPADGTIMAATIVDHVTPEMRIYSEESFGPIVSIIRARDTEHAVALANDSDYGLASAVFGQDVRRAMDVARRIESGICHINGPTVFDEAQMPFGGVKASGYGRFGGH